MKKLTWFLLLALVTAAAAPSVYACGASKSGHSGSGDSIESSEEV